MCVKRSLSSFIKTRDIINSCKSKNIRTRVIYPYV